MCFQLIPPRYKRQYRGVDGRKDGKALSTGDVRNVVVTLGPYTRLRIANTKTKIVKTNTGQVESSLRETPQAVHITAL